MNTLTLRYQGHPGRTAHGTVRSLSGLLQVWYQRARQRRQLAQLDDRALQDIGISRVQAETEAAKPFWQS